MSSTDELLAIAASGDADRLSEAMDALLTATTERDLSDEEQEFLRFAAAVVVGQAMVRRGVTTETVERLFLLSDGETPKRFEVDFKRDAEGSLTIKIDFPDSSESIETEVSP